MNIEITKTEFIPGEGHGPDMERVHYLLTNKYFNKVKDVCWFMPGTSIKVKRVHIKKLNMWRCFQPNSRVSDILFWLDRKYWKPGVKLCGK